jgi:hypothetical protein
MNRNDRVQLREYQRGYRDGRRGNRYADGSRLGVAAFTLGMAGGPRRGANAYREAYRDGRRDRRR